MGCPAACGRASHAALEPGAPYVLDAVRFDERLRGCAGVIAGEGRIDEQSVMGKIVGEIGDRALAAGVPLFAIVGRDSVPPEAAERIALRGVHEATTLAEIEATAERLGRDLSPDVTRPRRAPRPRHARRPVVRDALAVSEARLLTDFLGPDGACAIRHQRRSCRDASRARQPNWTDVPAAATYSGVASSTSAPNGSRTNATRWPCGLSSGAASDSQPASSAIR